MKIQGKLIKISSVTQKAPDDGVHRINSRGFLKHPNLRMLNGEFLYCGKNAFYYRISEDRGIKVFFSLKKKVGKPRSSVERTFCEMNKYNNALVNVHSIVDIELDLKTKQDPIIATVFGIEVDHIHYPTGAWNMFCLGYPYDFDCIDNPDHSINGFIVYQKSIKHMFPEKYEKAYYFGNVAWCAKRNKWIGMDLE